MENKKQNNKKIWLALGALVVAVAVLLGVYFATRKPATAGEKNITAEVVLTDGSATSFDITTTEEYLRGALESIDLIAGSESEFGLFVTTVNGITADDAAQQWWSFTRSGEMLQTGVDTTPIADGEHYEITLTEGY